MTRHNRDKPVDMVWLLRGGATDVYTSISNLARLQEFFPNNHLSDCNPYVLADSAGSYLGAALASPMGPDPRELPERFKHKIGSYLSPDRKIAEEALIEDIGPIQLDKSRIPICISTTEITEGLQQSYFRYFPELYRRQRNLARPLDNDSHIPMAKAAMASSAFPFYLGAYQIDDRTYIDMSFLETHASNLIEFVKHHQESCPDRRLVCVIFGTNYTDLRASPGEPLKIKRLREHFKDALSAFVQMNISQLTETLFGRENIFDLSLYTEQTISAKCASKLPHNFRSDPLAIGERIAWTDEALDNSPRHTETLRKLAEIIKRDVLPYAAFNPHGHRLNQSDAAKDHPVAPTGFKTRLSHATEECRMQYGPAIQAGIEIWEETAGWLRQKWDESRLGRTLHDSLLPDHSLRKKGTVPDGSTPPSQSHS